MGKDMFVAVAAVQQVLRNRHYSKRSFIVRMTCNKVGAIGRLDYPGVVCSLTWGIADVEGNVRKANTR